MMPRFSTLLFGSGRRASKPQAVVKNIDADDSADDRDEDDEDRSVFISVPFF